MAAKVRWWKNGDHPNDDTEVIRDEYGAETLTEGKVVKPYKPRSKEPMELCPVCSQAWAVHGSLSGTVVHPGDFIVTQDGGGYVVEHPDPMADALAAAEAAAAEAEVEADDAEDDATLAPPGP